MCVLVCWLVCAARALYSTPLPRFRDPRGQKVTTLPRKIHGSKSARLLPEPSRARPCQGFATLEATNDDPSTQNPRIQKRARTRSRRKCAHSRRSSLASSDVTLGEQLMEVQSAALTMGEPGRAKHPARPTFPLLGIPEAYLLFPRPESRTQVTSTEKLDVSRQNAAWLDIKTV